MEFFNDIDPNDVEIPSIPLFFYNSDNYNMIRIGKIILFYKFLCRNIKFCNADNDLKFHIIKDLERSCYHETLKTARDYDVINQWNIEEFVYIYHIKCGNVLSYLTHEENDPVDVNKFINKMLSINDYAKKFPTLTHLDLYPSIYEKLQQRRKAGEQKKIKYSEMYKCPRCKKSWSIIANRYNRSLDEGVNLMITCAWCGHERPG